MDFVALAFRAQRIMCPASMDLRKKPLIRCATPPPFLIAARFSRNECDKP